MTNGTATKGISLDELLAGMKGKHGAGPADCLDVETVPSPTIGRGRRRRGPDRGDRLSVDQAHERAIGVLHTLRGLSRAQQRRVLDR